LAGCDLAHRLDEKRLDERPTLRPAVLRVELLAEDKRISVRPVRLGTRVARVLRRLQAHHLVLREPVSEWQISIRDRVEADPLRLRRIDANPGDADGLAVGGA
jgi:hypothetical protein